MKSGTGKTAKKSPVKKSTPKKSMASTLMPNSEKEWQTKDDARTLKEAMAIKSDPSRLRAAQDYATKEMEALKQISRMK